MKQFARRKSIVFILVFILGASPILAANNTSIKSTYLGNGLFKYEMTVHPDPFLTRQLNSLAVLSFTNFIEVVEHSSNWGFASSTNSFSLEYPEGPDLERPYNTYCIVRSSNTHYRTVSVSDRKAYVLGSLWLTHDFFGQPYFNDTNTVSSDNIVMAHPVEAIIPCSENEADGSPASCEWSLEIAPDVLVDNVIIMNGEPQGLSFSWNTNCTVLVQASTNLSEWVDVEYALGSPPSTNWISTEPLDNYGTYFRLLLMAAGHYPELLSQGLHSEVSAQSTSPVLATLNDPATPATPANRIRGIKQGILKLEIDTIPLQKYAVYIKRTGSPTVIQTIEFIAQDKQTILDINTESLPTSISIEVGEMP